MTDIAKDQQTKTKTKRGKRVRRKQLPSRMPVPGQRFGSISQAVAYSSIGRTKLYELAGQHAGLFKKFGGRTVVDFLVYDAILDALPNAQIGA
jgi:hypothetical protein